MGQFRVDLILHPRNGRAARTMEALVDTGAAYTIVPQPVLESLGCEPLRSQRVVLADSRIEEWSVTDRKSTRLNSSHDQISYAVFCLKKKKKLMSTRTGRSKECIGSMSDRSTAGVCD